MSEMSRQAALLRDLSSLSDQDIFDRLKAHGVDAGPVTGSTRKLYLKLLVRAMSGDGSSEELGEQAGYSDLSLSTASGSMGVSTGGFDDSDSFLTFGGGEEDVASNRRAVAKFFMQIIVAAILVGILAIAVVVKDSVASGQ